MPHACLCGGRVAELQLRILSIIVGYLRKIYLHSRTRSRHARTCETGAFFTGEGGDSNGVVVYEINTKSNLTFYFDLFIRVMDESQKCHRMKMSFLWNDILKTSIWCGYNSPAPENKAHFSLAHSHIIQREVILIAVFSDIALRWPLPCVTFSSWEEFEDSSVVPSGVWISSAWSGDIEKLAGQLRASAFWYRHIHTEIPHGSRLLDGNCSLADAVKKARRLDFAASQMHVDISHLADNERLLFFLAIRQGFELVPVFDRASKGRYVYPLVQALCPDHDSPARLARYVASGLLEPVRLVDRIRTCRGCGSAQLSYVDVCPSCRSIEIQHTPSLHCFACGHVGRKASFELGGALACPKCEARLRHIGVDYDLPLAQFICKCCHAASMEALVVGRCYDCQATDTPEQLDVAEIYSYVIGERGVDSLRQGHSLVGTSLNGAGHHVVPGYFRQLLGWSSSTQRRYQGFHFGVVLIEFLNTGELLAHHGSHRVTQLLSEFAQRLRQVIRDCDVTSSDSLERIWVLLPSTLPETTAARLVELANTVRPSHGPALEVRTRTFFSSRDMDAQDDSHSIMTKMLAS